MLEVKNLETIFHVDQHIVTAVDHISFSIPEKSVLGLVGESGSGKSVTAYSILNLLPPNGQIRNGEILWKGENLRSYSERQLRHIRGAQIALIFQNPLAALNPVFTIGNQMIETIQLHQSVTQLEAENIAIDLLSKVSIADPKKRLADYPHQFSLGMCQRIMIALSLSMKPKLLIADEPTASLDVTIQAQILELLAELKESHGLSILLISHDLGVIAQNCDNIMVMYLGDIVEKGTPEKIFKSPLHPYTSALIQSIPTPDPSHKPKACLSGDIPSPINIPSGCRFHTRCPMAKPICKTTCPTLKKVKSSEVSCLLVP